MKITDALLPEYDHEMGTTRKLLERLPDTQFAWKPHEKSMSLGRLATHIAELPGWVSSIIGQDEFDMGTGEYTPREAASRTEILKQFDENVAVARSAIASKSDAELMAPWTFKRGGQTLFTLPKVAVVRTWLLNHVIHHRGQLSVFLRVQNVPIPAIYGPSADESA
jgi:uncharacterized damage-inducible protein DinB